jgi:hypothetical protein
MKLNHRKDGPELTERLEKIIFPLLRGAKGFRDIISYVTLGRTGALIISFWNNKASADAYNRDQYPNVLKALKGLLNGNPRVESCEVGMSTFHELAVAPAYATNAATNACSNSC